MANIDNNTTSGSGADVTLDALHIQLRDSATGAALAKANRATFGATSQGLPIVGLNDDNFRMIRTDRFGGLASALHTPMFSEPFENATINTQRLVSASATFVPAQTALGWSANSTALTTANAHANITSRQQFAKQQRIPMQLKARIRATRLANVQHEIGWGSPSTTTVPVNGSFIRLANDTATLVNVFNGVETQVTLASSLAALSASWDSEFFTIDVILDDDEAVGIIQATDTGLILAEARYQMPRTSNRLWAVSHLPVFARSFIGATAAASAPTFIVSDMMVTALDAHSSYDAATLQAINEFGALANPTTGIQLQQFTNSSEPASATLSNTATSNPTLGGKFQFAAPAGAATDFALFGFQVPAPYQLVIHGISIDTWNSGAASAITPTRLEWGIATNLTAVSLATPSHLRRVLGSQSIPIATAVGARADRAIDRAFRSPMICEPGLFLDIILRVPVGTATASQVIAGSVDIDGYFR